MSRLRAFLKTNAPPQLRQAVIRARAAINGPGIETTALGDYTFAADPDPRPRVTLVLPSLSASEAFGGVSTALDFAFELAAETGADLRFVAEKPIDLRDDVLAGRDGFKTMSLATEGGILPTRAREVFLLYNWWISLNMEPVLRAQAAHFDQAPLPKVPLIQEYEPHFYPFSAAHLLALEAFNGEMPIWGVFNSTELLTFYTAQGNRHDRTYVIEPRLAPALAPFVQNLDRADKRRTVLVYGRPEIARNAFSLIERGLAAWATRHGDAHRDWRFVSAGAAHAPIDFANGVRLASVGKLDLASYGALLRETSVGISLMVSPHPSYPPLEMAHFGARVITNAYANKRPQARHDNLIALPSARPETMAAQIEAEIIAWEADPGHGVAGASHMPGYLTGAAFDCVAPLARDLAPFFES